MSEYGDEYWSLFPKAQDDAHKTNTLGFLESKNLIPINWL